MNSEIKCPIDKMRAHGLNAIAIDHFKKAYNEVIKGNNKLISETSIEPINSVKKYEELDSPRDENLGSILDQSVIIKLNGGLGTSMGLNSTKSLLNVRGELTFMDFIVNQIIHLRNSYNNDVRFLLMNSFSTSEETKEFLLKYPELGLPEKIELIQNMIPKIDAETYEAVSCDHSPELEWCPPGHGDIYAALLGVGMLDTLVDSGVKYAFISNSDNLGATLDFKLLNEFLNSDSSFMMEVTRRTDVDKKGGHLAKDSRNGNFLLREVAQCPEEDFNEFQNVNKHRYFNTNNIWIRLDRLRSLMRSSDNNLNLPLIINRKNLNPSDSQSSKVIQIEVAMGAAIQCFEDSTVIEVPRSRFSPVKSCEDLLALRSDAYQVSDDFEIQLCESRGGIPPEVGLSDEIYKNYKTFEEMTPYGPPSLKKCKSIQVEGPVKFGKEISFQGTITITNDSKLVKEISSGKYIENNIVL